MRDKSIDIGRGILTILMVYCHVLQFFADGELFPAVWGIIDIINLTVFQTFVFYFGATAVLAYLNRTYRTALPGMIKTGLRAYGAFVISGVAFRVLRENKAFAPGTVRRVMQLTDIPGWSEFLIAFSGYALLLIVLFPVFQRIADRPVWALGLGIASLIGAQLIPYGAVSSVRLAIFIGGRQFSYFPVLHYLPFLLAGMVYARGDGALRIRLLMLAAVCAAAGIVLAAINGGLPGRFPPTLGWLLLGAGNTALVVLAGKGIDLLPTAALRWIGDAMAHLGSRSLYYLLASNLVIFTMAGKGIVPAIARKSVLPWTMPIQSPQGAACWTMLLLAALWFVASLAGRSARKKA